MEITAGFKQKETPKVRAGTNMYSETTTGLHQIRAPVKCWHQSNSVFKNVVRETEIYNQIWTSRLEIKETGSLSLQVAETTRICMIRRTTARQRPFSNLKS